MGAGDRMVYASASPAVGRTLGAVGEVALALGFGYNHGMFGRQV